MPAVMMVSVPPCIRAGLGLASNLPSNVRTLSRIECQDWSDDFVKGHLAVALKHER